MSKISNKQFFAILFIILIITFSYFGMKYYTIADDNNQLGIYHLERNNIYNNVINKYKLYNVRPLAFFSDAYIFQWFWDNMYALMCIIILMHICSIYFLYKICEKIGVKLNAFFIVLFALAPILFEALYWISASTRIVFSLFLTLSSIYLLLLSFDEEVKWKKLLEFLSAIILNLICVGFYEQTITLNLFLFCFVLICLKKYKYLFIPFVSTIWIGIYYVCSIMNGQMQSRGTMNFNGILGTSINLVKLIGNMFSSDIINIKYILKERTPEELMNYFVLIVLVILIAYVLFIVFKREGKSEIEKIKLKKVILGIILFVSPILPFIVLSDNYFSVRNLYLPFLGVCIILEVVFEAVLYVINKLLKNNIILNNVLKLSLILFVMIISILANIDKLNDYKKVHELDNKISKEILEVLDDDVFENQKTISVNYDLNNLYEKKDITNYVSCALETDWALMGKLQVERKDRDIGQIYINSNKENADYVLYFDENLEIIK